MNSFKLFVQVMMAIQIIALLQAEEFYIKLIQLGIITWAIYLLFKGVA